VVSVLNQVIGVWAALREVSASEAAKASRKVRRNSYRKSSRRCSTVSRVSASFNP